MAGDGRAGPVANDLQDTLPTDVMTLPVPPEPKVTFSPDIPTSSKREAFQRQGKPKKNTQELDKKLCSDSLTKEDGPPEGIVDQPAEEMVSKRKVKKVECKDDVKAGTRGNKDAYIDLQCPCGWLCCIYVCFSAIV